MQMLLKILTLICHSGECEIGRDRLMGGAGAQDGTVKMWDLRQVGGAADEVRLPYDTNPSQVHRLPPCQKESKPWQACVTIMQSCKQSLAADAAFKDALRCISRLGLS